MRTDHNPERRVESPLDTVQMRIKVTVRQGPDVGWHVGIVAMFALAPWFHSWFHSEQTRADLTAPEPL